MFPSSLNILYNYTSYFFYKFCKHPNVSTTTVRTMRGLVIPLKLPVRFNVFGGIPLFYVNSIVNNRRTRSQQRSGVVPQHPNEPLYSVLKSSGVGSIGSEHGSSRAATTQSIRTAGSTTEHWQQLPDVGRAFFFYQSVMARIAAVCPSERNRSTHQTAGGGDGDTNSKWNKMS